MRCGTPAMAAFVAVTTALTSVVSAPPTQASNTIKAASMQSTPPSAGQKVADGSASDGIALALIPASSASTRLAVEGTSTVLIRAKGPVCDGTALISTSVDGNTRSSTRVGAEWSEYSFASSMPPGSHTLSVTYSYVPGITYPPSSTERPATRREGTESATAPADCDRSLRLDTISVIPTSAPVTPATSTAEKPAAQPDIAPTAEVGIPFASSSPFNTKISRDARLDPKTAAMVARATRTNALNANLVQFGIPIYQATTGSPGAAIPCTVTEWGRCPFDGYQIPIPANAKASPGSDGALVIVDSSTRRVYELWQAAKDGQGGWTASFGGVSNLDGPGWGGAGTGAGASRLAGVIRISEIAAGLIPHALALQVDNSCAGVFRAPAIKTDGTASRADCIPEGSLIRLNPSVDLSALPLNPAQRAVGRALQEYGGYVVDRGGAPLSVSFELDPTATGGKSVGAVYQRAGLRWDYDSLDGLPLSQLQVLG
jgi:hypothetical protein